MSNIIANLNKPTLILSHNKTLAGQLYGEFKEFFPHNAVEYFVSYYDYYQPEAYVPSTDTYIEKIVRLTTKLINCGTAPPVRCWNEMMSSWWPQCRQSLV